MKELLRAPSTKLLEKKIKHAVGRGWTVISEIQEDPTSFDPEFVVVVEMKDKPHKEGNHWGAKYHMY